MADDRDLADQPVRARGLQRLPDPRVWGTTIGAAGATVFVLASRQDLPGPVAIVALVAWALALLAYVWFVFVVVRAFPPAPAVGARAGLVYLASVIGMLVLIRLGTVLLDDSGHDELRPALIVVVVGLHFLPFAAAFHTPMFRLLGLLMAVIGGIGLGLGWLADGRAAAVAAVVAGLTMLVVIAEDAARH